VTAHTASPAKARNNVIDPSRGLRDQVSARQLVMILIGVMLGMLLSAVDQTVVGTAMPRIIADLHGLTEYAWVTTSYLLASTVMVPIYGKLSDVYGRKPFFMLGMAIFLAGSALSGTSQNMTQLILYRGIQGLGAGAMMPIVLAIIGDIFPPAERGKWQGLMMAVFGLASIIGPWAGGAITDSWGWRWVFYVNMPLGILALAFCAVALPSIYQRSDHTIDYPGSAILVVAAVPMLLGFSWAGNQYTWTSWQVLGAFAVSAVAWVVFFIWEARTKEPILAPRLFKNGIFTISVVTSFFVSLGMFGAIMYIPLFMQAVIGDSASNSGIVLTPMMLGFMASSVIGGQIMSRTGKYRVLSIVSLAVAVFGMFLLGRMGVDATNALVIRDMVITGLGMGTMMSLFTIVVQNAFPFQEMGVVTAALQFFRSIGGTVGIAILGSLLTSRFTHELPKHIPTAVSRALPPSAVHTIANPSVLLSPGAFSQMAHVFARFGPAGIQMAHALILGVRTSLALATQEVFIAGSLLLAVAFVMSWFLREIPLRRHSGHSAFDMEGRPRTESVTGDELYGRVGVALGLLLQSEAGQALADDPETLERMRALTALLLQRYLGTPPPELPAVEAGVGE
jgi:EmrB/QacA subfamily drug resistance transporter